MKAFYGSRFSPNQTMTPEGFLVAHNVPISRAGWYEYLGHEIGADTDDVVKVYRDPDEVFSPAAMASFEGKPTTDGHPPNGVTPENAQTYAKGAVQNVRRGTGENADLLLADLIFFDERLIRDIQDGKREVSAGYECEYVPNGDDTYSQRNIVGNHVAVVENGRAGNRVRIQDQRAPNMEYKNHDDLMKLIDDKAHNHLDSQEIKDALDEGGQYYVLTKVDPRTLAVEDKDNLRGVRDDFDQSNTKPIIVGKGGFVIDGRHRVMSAINAGVNKIDAYVPATRTSNNDAKPKEDTVVSKKLKLPLRKQSRVTDVLAAIGLKHFAADAEPDEIVEAVDAMAEERNAVEEEPAKQDTTPAGATDADPVAELAAKVDHLTAIVTKLVEAQAKPAEPSPEDALDAAIAQLSQEDPHADNREEESHTIDPSQVADEEGPVQDPEDRPKNPLTGDNAYKIKALKAMKPILAAISDPVERKKAADAAIASIKGRPSDNTYAQIQQATKKKVGDATKPQPAQKDVSQLGREWAKKFNPHYKEQ